MVRAGTSAELERAGRLVIKLPASDDTVVVVSTRRGLYAFDSVCPHLGGPLDGGAVARATVTCPWHGRRYSLQSGRCVPARGAGPRLRRWRVWMEDGQVWIDEEVG